MRKANLSTPFPLAALVLHVGLALPSMACADSFRFAVFGDLQEETDEGHRKDLHLVDAINSAEPRFTVFVGDIQGGGPCTDRQREEAAEIFAAIEGPLIFTPGDNEWTDCRLPGKGDWEPLERLAMLRERLIPDGRSLGQRPIESR